MHDAIKEDYLETLVNGHTKLLNSDVPKIFNYLFYNYSKVRSEEVIQKESEIILIS